jgi:hypothetical protein
LYIFKEGKGTRRIPDKRERGEILNSAFQFPLESQDLKIHDKKHFKGFIKGKIIDGQQRVI